MGENFDRELIQQTLDALDDVFYVIDGNGSIQWINHQAAAITGYSIDELIGMNALEVIAPDDREAVARDIAAAGLSGGANLEASVLTATGETIPYEFRKQAIVDEEGTLIGLAGIGRDISGWKRHERQLERQAKQFASFASILTHDLRNPISVIEGRIALAQETGDLAHLDAASRAVERLDSLIDDLASTMREGSLVNDPTVVELETAARSSWSGLDAPDAQLIIEGSRPIKADEHALIRLLDNVFRNAIEHAGPTVSIVVGSTENGFYVEDDGPGIPAAKREAIFRPGFSTKADDGGFGMTSVQQIAFAHGWSVDVSTGSRGGARFDFADIE